MLTAIKTKVSDYALEHNKWPLDLKSMTIESDIKLLLDNHYEVKNGVIFIQGQLILMPSRVGKIVTWVCNDSSIAEEYRFDDC